MSFVVGSLSQSQGQAIRDERCKYINFTSFSAVPSRSPKLLFSRMLDLKHFPNVPAGSSRTRPLTNSSVWTTCRRPQCCRYSCAAERPNITLKVPIAALLSTAMFQPQLAASATPLSPEQLHARLLTLASIDGRTAGQLAVVLGPLLSGFSLLMIVRIVLSWYPQIDGKKLPWSIAVAPTEPVLGPTRRLIQPVGGVDVSPVRLALLSAASQLCM